MSIPLNPEAVLPADFIAFTHEGVLLAYDPLTGRGLRWRTSNGRGTMFRWHPITPSAASRGCTLVGIAGSIQLWHRVVAQHFLNGGNPIRRDLDVYHRNHVDGTASQDILTNLRIVTKRENQQNQKPRSSQYAGVCWDKRAGKWRARAMNRVTGRDKHLGYFTDERKAASAYIDYCIQHNLPHAPALERFAAA